MTERELLLQVFRREKSERMPWYADLSYLYQSLEQKEELEPAFRGLEGYLEFYRQLGAGICFYAPMLWDTHYASGITYTEEKQGRDIVFEYKTPGGTIRQTYKYLPSTYTWAISEHYVNTINDLRTVAYIWENSSYIPEFKRFADVDEMWSSQGIAVAFPPVCASPIQKMLTRWAGVETTVDLMMDHETEFDELLLRIVRSEDYIYRIIEQSPAILVEFAENISSEVTGRTLYEKYSLDYYRKRNEDLHKAGKYTSVHIDGTLKGCFELLGASGFDAAEAVTPAPTGDLTVEELRKYAGKDLIIWGGLPGALFSPHYSDNEFLVHLRNVIDVFSDDSKFVLGVADQVPPDGLTERIKKVREMISCR